ncbi:T9SS outer membrane translocon Sov/SprA [Wenyingzhuangia aestuarii]|uniref:T9SS outer membrane translocon Sov/SprA n=1 Tax=Wenyingzhuangia aestuarii TaxID=1647582 RepID=UPI00143C4F7F|nr:cell surface protein SprA [Wenyingzhuangia aestuarii]NJB81368.1 cell surface protein SprA [Wenyingzhuangia aestuarii]
MKKCFQIILLFFFVVSIGYGQEKEKDTLNLEEEKHTFSFDNTTEGVLYLKNPTEKKIEYDPTIGRYIVRETIGNTSFTTPKYLTEEEYKEYRLKQDVQNYFKAKTAAIEGKKKDAQEAQKDLLPTMYVNNRFFETLFGGTEIKLVPRGSVTMRFGVLYQNIENPLLSEENRSSFTPEFDQQIRANLTAKVGERLNADINYDTQSTFSFQNQLKLDFEPGEDDLIRKLEVGNINMDIKNNLITGSQSLFGVKAQLQFGATTVTGVFSQQQSQAKNIIAEGGSALTEFELRTTQYDNNRHFFIAQYFRNNYNTALAELPLINSAVQITKLEVWVTNRNTNTQDVRNIVGLVDLGESGTDKYDNSKSNISNNTVTETPINPQFIPDNKANSLSQYIGTDKTQLRDVENVPTQLSGFEQGREYAVVENARKLNASEFTYNQQLGFISLNSRLNDGDVLAVAFEYTYRGEAYRVGELSTDGIESDKNIVVKLVRPQLINTEDVVFNLLMKNVYSIGAYNLDKEGFVFNLLYRDDATGQATNNLLGSSEDDIKKRTILNLTNLDRLDANNNLTRDVTGKDYQTGDGFFDFIDGLTVDTKNGSIIFPLIEPFGRDLESLLSNQADRDKYVFKELYTTTASVAENDYQKKDKFLVQGQYSSSTSDGISLGAFNVPRGSVTVTAGGIVLVEGIDYTVDYFAGKVKIINPSIESSGQAINVSLENNTFFNQQQKTFVGVDVEHKFSDNFVLGATYLNIKEQPISNKVQLGQDPVNNSMYGLNVNYSSEVPVLTDLVNYLPNIDTDAPSNISVRGDFAYLRPNTPSSIDIGGEATTYLDDFEGAQIPINLGTAQNWSLSSAPVGFDGRDFGANNSNSLEYGKKRAKLAWYTIDQLFYTGSSLKPQNIDPDELSRAEVRPVQSEELFPERNLDVTQRTNLQTFDLSYYPNERGPYNYTPITNPSKPSELTNPEDKWAGITRGLVVTDFQRSNIQYVEFWVQNPYENYSITNNEGIVTNPNPTNQKGTLYLNLGSISEDILKDNRKVFENGLPENGDTTTGVDETVVANIPTEKSLLYAFDQGDDTRRNQDVGYDGMSDAEEKTRFPDLGSLADPSSDNFRFFRSTQYDSENASILKRYKDYNNTQGNSPTAALSQESYPTSATNNPDVEDADRDQTMNTIDSYWQYKVDLSQNNLNKTTNEFIVDERTTTVTLENNTEKQFKWYLFRVPIAAGESIGGINSFQSIRFMRMFLTDFEIPVTLRFADFQIVRGDWRIYDKVIDQNDNLSDRGTENLLETGVVNIEENENRVPVNYILPPTISREALQGTSNVLQQNEQSLTVKVDKLEQNNTIGVYKNINVDMRMFKRLKMFIHAEEILQNTVDDDDLVAVIRLGSDTNDNYYQIEVPLTMTDIPNFGTGNALNARAVWPENNDLDISLLDLTKVKLDRDKQGQSVTAIYPEQTTIDNSQTVLRVKGNPNLSNVRTIFLGIKNLDATQKSAEIWFNELRMSGFDNQGGWATKISADATIADFAKIAVNGGYQSIGFGSIDQSISERSQEEIKNYSVNTTVNAGQLLPNNWNVRIPVNYTISEEIRTPKFDPKYEDVLAKDAIEQGVAAESIDIRTKRRSISLINVKKERSEATLRKPQIYDVENFSMSYSYSDATNESYVIEKDISQNVNASANYAFKFKQIEVKPLENIPFLKSKNLSLLRDFNFNLLPSDISVNSSIKRNYSEYKSRDLSEVAGLDIPTLKQRNFMFDWDYRIGYQLTDAINLNFNASNNYIYDTFEQDAQTEEELDRIDLYSNFFNVGRPNNYTQNLTATYKIPINKIPLLSFINADYSYTGNFNWRAASPDFVEKVGNTIQNGNTHNVSTNLNFSKLYSEIGLKKLFSSSPKKRMPSPGKTKKKSGTVGDFVYGVLSSIKTGRVSYNKNRSSSLDGYVPEIGFLGRNKYNGGYAPSLGYVFGQQTDIVKSAVQNGWLLGRSGATDDVVYNKNYNQTEFTSLNYDITLKPIQDLNIQLTGSRSYSDTEQQQIDYITGSNDIESAQVNKSGNYNISYSLIKTAMGSDPDALFNTFVTNRAKVVTQVYPGGDVTSDQALNSQEVLIHSFLAAYSGTDVVSSNKTIFKKMPLPNWNITYRGLMRLDFIKKNFSNFTLSHGYNSSYTISNFSNNLNSDTSNPYQSSLIYSGITLIDAFSPLIKLDVKFKSSLSFRGTINTNRTLSLNLNNTTLSEINGNEYVFGIGYRFKDVKIKTRFLRKQTTLKGDINIKADVSYKTDITNIRSIDTLTSQPVGGQNLFGIKVAADYNLSRNFTASLYYDQNVASYAISTLYPRQSVNTGLSLVYNLGN